MNKIATFRTDVINVLTLLMLTLLFLGLFSFWVTNHAPVIADLIQSKLPSTEALLQWVAVR